MHFREASHGIIKSHLLIQRQSTFVTVPPPRAFDDENYTKIVTARANHVSHDAVCFRIWYMGLCWILRGLKRQQQLTDRRSRWLKEKYLQLYFEKDCVEPITADAIKAFGGRDWSASETIGTLSPTSSTLRKRKTKKTKSISNIHALTKVCKLYHRRY